MKKIYEHRKRGAYFRIRDYSWWDLELPTDEEMKNGIKNLEKVNYKVDYIISHCCPTSIQTLLNPSYKKDILTDYLQEISEKLTAGLEATRILQRCAGACMRPESAWCWTVCSTMWEEASGPFRMCRRKSGTPPTRTGLSSILTETAATMTASGTRAGKDTTSWSS